MDQFISLSYSFLQKYLPAAGVEKTFILFELNGKVELSKRSPINLSVVLDRSGSMSGKPLYYCKEATKFIVNQLQEKDLLNVVVFDDQVRTILPPQEVKHKDLLKKKIDEIDTGGITNLSGGLIKGCQHILNQNTDLFVNRVILLSDGQANAGVTDFDHLMKVVDDYQTAGAVISTMGVSDHFNEELMEGIAEHGKGNYYFINDAEQIPDIFAQELEGLLSVVAQDVNFKLNPKMGVRIEKVYGYMTETRDNSIEISLGDMFTNEVKSILVEFTVPGMPSGVHDLFDIEWSFVDVKNGVKDCRSTLNIPAEITTDLDMLSIDVNAHVDKQIEITKSAQKLEEAMRLFDEGNIESGKELLFMQASSMAEKAQAHNDLELLAESQVIFSQLENFEYTKQKRKELHQQKYRQMKRRKQENVFSNKVQEKLNLLKKWLKQADQTVIFTGAGMSTEAGLPDFRSASSGMWNNINPLELASTEAMEHNRQQFIDFYRHRVEGLQSCQPHTGHRILSKWEAAGKIQSIITQNVDGFHHTAGNHRIEELHGTLRSCHCHNCGRSYPIERFMGEDLTCSCGGFIRPSVVLFGESLPEKALNQAAEESEAADLFIVLGSSLSVSPANYFPIEAKRNGAKLVIINIEETALDPEADLVINGEKIGSILRELDN